MATEHALEQARQARRLFDDDLVNELFDYLETEQLSLIMNSSPDQAPLRESAYQMLKAIGRFRSRLLEIASETAHARSAEQARTIMQ